MDDVIIIMELDCAICHEPFHKLQKLLLLQHSFLQSFKTQLLQNSFCDPRLRKMVNAIWQTTNNYHNSCPYCRTPIKKCVPDTKLAKQVSSTFGIKVQQEREELEYNAGLQTLQLPPLEVVTDDDIEGYYEPNRVPDSLSKCLLLPAAGCIILIIWLVVIGVEYDILMLK